MKRQKIEDEALSLPRDERAALLQKLVLSLDAPTPEELRDEWLLEARRRADDLDSGRVKSIPGDEVLRKARNLIK